MKLLSFFCLIFLAAALSASAAEKDTRIFEMRTYYAAPDKLDALHKRFRDHTTKLFETHGITGLGYWTPLENPDNKLVYVVAYPDREHRDASWKAFNEDPDWKKAKTESERDGKLVAKVEQLFMTATDFSPPIKPSTGPTGRVFELRTYTTTPGNLNALHARFRDHTMALFTKHDITNLFYWQLTPAREQDKKTEVDPDNTLVYLLSHESVEAAKASWNAFRADPDWVTAKKASEDQAGGSLTTPNGVQSVFLKPTDYSPTR